MMAADRQPSPLEERISAYIDGRGTERDRQEIEAALVNDPDARAVQDHLKRGSDLGQRLFEDMLKEPVPLQLVRDIKNAQLPRKAVRLPGASRASMAFKPKPRHAVAGGLLMLLLGGAIGFLIGTEPPSMASTAVLPGQATETRDWLDDLIAHYRLYSRQESRLVEIEGGRPADILEWLTTGTGVTFRIPDLSASGLTFVGARMIAAERTPTGMLFYRRSDPDTDGEVLALTFSKAKPDTSRPVEDIRLDTGLVSWSTPLATYVLVGPSSAADLDDIAAKAAGLI